MSQYAKNESIVNFHNVMKINNVSYEDYRKVCEFNQSLAKKIVEKNKYIEQLETQLKNKQQSGYIPRDFLHQTDLSASYQPAHADYSASFGTRRLPLQKNPWYRGENKLEEHLG